MIRPRRRDAGISMILVVVLLLITMILVVAATLLHAEYRQKERAAAALRKEHDRLLHEESELKSLMTRVNEPTGFKMPEDGATLPSREAEDLARRKRQEYVSAENLSRVPLAPPLEGRPRPPVNPEVARRFESARDESRVYATLQELTRLAAARAFLYKTRADQLALELEIAKEQTRNREAVKDDFPKRKREENDRLVQEISRLNTQISNENNDFNARKAQLTEAKAKAEAEIQEETQKYAQDEIRYKNEINRLRDRLEELKVKEVITHEIAFVHGKILRPDVPNRTAFIDIGSRDRVVPGLKFLVGKRGVQGKFEYKAKIEVKKVWSDTSEVSIIEVYDPTLHPVVDGDFIVNPLFSKERPIVVAFVGEEQPIRLRYSVDEASRRIREIGSEVRKDVTLDVDYVIFTEGKMEQGGRRDPKSYEGYRKAVFLEIPIAEASDVYRFLGD
ncbi:MAG TPA: hypothetical protein VNO22_17020 [Planctomycetota bacterium]|jgi:hypothetical protein|nr:hypothetical protein [Planctomycetota bacterium]